MSTKTPTQLETDETAQKRAQWEQFSYDVEAAGLVDVTNESHENPAENRHVVTLDDVTDDAMACTCPHHVHQSAYCEYMAAVEDATDEGTLTAFPSEDNKSDVEEAEPAECDCDGLNGFTCWECVKTGRKALPN